MGVLGIRAFIDMEEGRSNYASKIAKRILEMDGSINFKKLRRAMKTFIIMEKGFMKNLSTV